MFGHCRQLAGCQNKNERVGESHDLKAPRPSGIFRKDTSTHQAYAKSYWLASTHRCQCCSSPRASRKCIIDDTDGCWKAEGCCNAREGTEGNKLHTSLGETASRREETLQEAAEQEHQSAAGGICNCAREQKGTSASQRKCRHSL